jgi:hypothetical protein
MTARVSFRCVKPLGRAPRAGTTLICHDARTTHAAPSAERTQKEAADRRRCLPRTALLAAHPAFVVAKLHAWDRALGGVRNRTNLRWSSTGTWLLRRLGGRARPICTSITDFGARARGRAGWTEAFFFLRMARSRPGWRRTLEGDRGGIRSAMIPPRQNHGGSKIVWGKQVLLQNSRGFERAWT